MVAINTRLDNELLDKLDMLCARDQRSRSFKMKQFAEKSVREFEEQHGEIIIDTAILNKFRSQFKKKKSVKV